MNRARFRFPAWLLAVALLLAALPAFAQERILGHDSVVEVQADGSLHVTERIRVRAEGRSIRRGIYRDFPTRYRDRHGNNMVAGFEVVGVERDGRAEPWFTQRRGNGIRVNTGNDDLLPVPLDTTYTLRYRTTRQLGFFEAHDELYWNAIGHGWDFPIEAGSVEVRLPDPVAEDALGVDGWTGRQRARGRAFEAGIAAPGTARWTLVAPLSPGEGLTILLTFPKGVVAPPTSSEATAWLLRDNLALLAAIAGLLVLVAFCLKRWHRVGRDPAPGVVIARYEPPRGESPSALRYMLRRGYDGTCLTSELLACAVAGTVHIEHQARALGDRWTLRREPENPGTASADGQRLLDALLPEGKPELRLGKAKATRVQAAMSAHDKGLRSRFQPAMFRRNGGSIAIAFGIFTATLLASLMLAVAAEGGGMPWALVPLGLAFVVASVFAFVVEAPTPDGRRLLDEIEGFKRYLSVAEQDDLARLQGPVQADRDAPPPLDAARFEALLPYAVALDVEKAWTDRFTAAVGTAAAAAATAGITWYHGSGATDAAGFTRAIGQALDSRIASSSTPPGSSTGSGGGGFSGGGGGGGGGGGR